MTPKRTYLERLSLDEVARRLRHERISKVAESYRERSASLRRLILGILLLGWTAFWMVRVPTATSHEGGTLWIEARHLFPWMAGLVLVNAAWCIYLSLRTDEAPWREAFGAIGTYLGIWIVLANGWNIAISTITFLPLTTIVVGTRFSRRAFYGAMVLSIVLLGTAAPSGYWGARPAFIPFALILLIGLPLIVTRLLTALYEISAAAVMARDGQTRMTAMISHELRTPLNTICNAPHLIEADTLNDDARELWNAFSANADTLLYRVNQVLDVAAIDNRRLYLETEPFLVAELVRSVYDVVGNHAARKQVRFTIHVDPRVPKALLGDVGRIEQVLTNLASNAIKFTPQNGRVALNVEVNGKMAGKEKAALRFNVIDTGIGITDADKEYIFSPFYQVSSGPDRRSEGVGLGLHIVKGVSDEMNGHLSVTDNPGGGTIFTWDVEIPAAASDDIKSTSKHVLDALRNHSLHYEPLRCLVVDDNAPNRDIMRRILSKAGHEVDVAEDGSRALQVITQKDYDIVFLDLHMPHLSGLEVLGRIKSMNTKAQVAVISADSDSAVVRSMLDAGAKAYLLKPVPALKVLDILEQIAAPRPVVQPIGVQTAKDVAPSALDVIRSLGDSAAVADYIAVLVNELRAGQSDIETQASHGSREALAATLHGLRNSLGNAGESTAMEECESARTAVLSGSDYTLAVRHLRLTILRVLSRLERDLADHQSARQPHGESPG